jgi:hypothetical protein
MILTLSCSSGSRGQLDGPTPLEGGAVDTTPDMGPVAGEEGGPCYPNDTCNAGLTCASGLCVKLPDSGVPDSGVPDTAPTDTAPPDTTPSGTLNVYWNINGTVSGASKGVSWDTCAEVAAPLAAIEVDGVKTTSSCHAGGNMSAALAVPGKPSLVRIRLEDSGGNGLTTWTPAAAPDPVAGKPQTWEYVGEFYWDSFIQIKNTMKGDYWFKTTYEGKGCNQVTPTVAHQVALLKLGGTVVSPPPDVCDSAGTSCVKADGASFGACTGQSQKIVSTSWGEYKLKLSGTLGSASAYEICWEKQFDIVIGAGTTNPLVAHDVPRISTTGACIP